MSNLEADRPKRQKTGGRKKNTPNKATAEVKALAQPWGPKAIKKLAELGGLVPKKPAAESEQAQAMACREILDRAYGKATQPVEHGGTAIEELLAALRARR